MSVILNLLKDLLFCTHKEEILPPYGRLNDRDNHFVIGSLLKDLLFSINKEEIFPLNVRLTIPYYKNQKLF